MKGIKYILALSAAVMLVLGVSNTYSQGKPQVPVQNRQGVIDANGDGICDITGQKIGTGAANAQGQQAKRGKQNGPGDGTGNLGTRPQDGTGYGSLSGKRTGPQDGSKARIGQGTRPGAAGAQMGGRGRKK